MAASGNEIGPMLPPSMSSRQDDRPTSRRTETSGAHIGPSLPPHLIDSGKNSDDRTTSSVRDRSSVGGASDCGIGPALPPGMGRERERRVHGVREEDDDSIGPALPPHMTRRCEAEESSATASAKTLTDPHHRSTDFAGPCLPPGLVRDQDSDEDEDDAYGPALPPGFTRKSDSSEKLADVTIGPTLPPGFRKAVAEKDSKDEDSDQQDGDSEDESSEEEVIGPMPPSEHDVVRSHSAAEALEARALAMKNKLERKDEDITPARDSWMTELPEFSKDFGLGPRTFRKNARPDEKDRSGWTDTPADRARKRQERMEKAAAAEMESSKEKEKKKKKKKKRERQAEELSERDRRLVQEVAKHNQSARPESLMDMHTKIRKRKLEEQTEKPERRPFDREMDLQVNRFDDAKRKQLVKKSAHLGDKFSHSSEKMYL